jgi:hypothetical protein
MSLQVCQAILTLALVLQTPIVLDMACAAQELVTVSIHSSGIGVRLNTQKI